MNSEVQTDKSRRNAARLPSDSKSLTSANPTKNSAGRSSQLRGDQHKPEDLSSRHWTLASEGFPPGVTVDELKHYRRRRHVSETQPKDNLPSEEGSLSSYTSEYRRRYRAYDRGDWEFYSNIVKDSTRKAELNLEDKQEPTTRTELKPSEAEFPRERTLLKRPKSNLQVSKEQPMESNTEKNSQYVPFANPERRKLLRRSTALKPEGEMAAETEVRSQFRGYENPEKAVPIRRPPSLKLEGDFEPLTTEQKEKFISHLFGERPVLRKKNTLLKMEGDFDFLTEKQVSFVPHGPNERPFPRKRSTSLKLDGEVEFFPEYRSSYVDFPRSRPITYKPTEHLRNEGEIESQTETKTKFIDFQEFPTSLPARPTNNLQVEGGLEIRPEYKENFVDFPRSRPFTMRPENNLKQEGDFEMRTEKSEEMSKILAEDARRPTMVRRSGNLRLEGDLDFSTEKREQFKGHEIRERLLPARREGNLLLEGEFDFKTESEDKFSGNSAPPGPSDFRKRSSFLQSGEFQPVFDYGRSSPRQPLSSPNRGRPADGQPVKSKLIPYKTEYYGLGGDLAESDSRRASRRNSKRLKENIPEAASPFATIPRTATGRHEESLKLDGESEKTLKSIEYPSSLRAKMPPSDNLRLDAEEFSSCLAKPPFDPVVDIMQRKHEAKAVDETASDTSDTSSVARHQPSFRLEVYNVDANPQGFHRGRQRVFPPEGIPTETINYGPDSFLERKRNAYYGKTVNCPEVPNYILDKNNNLGGLSRPDTWDLLRKDDPNGNPRVGFNPPAAADSSDEKLSSSSTAADREPENWTRPNWLTT